MTERDDVTRVLTVPEVEALGAIVNACTRHARVVRLMGDPSASAQGRGDSDIVGGTARAIHSPDTEFLPRVGEDIRDCRLWVTTESGFETWWPISELVPELRATTFVIQDAGEERR